MGLGKLQHSFFLMLTLDGGEWSVSHPVYFTAMIGTPSQHCIEGWMGPRHGLDNFREEKISRPAGNRKP
jgi:hypothetical protein